MKIIVDAFGGDNAPLEILKGCALAVEELGVELMLTGDEAKIKACAAENGISLDKMEIVHAPDVIAMEDHPDEILKSKSGCSMAEGLRRLAAGEGEAFVTAGSTGAAVMGSTFLVKRIKGVKRAALAPLMPSDKGPFMCIDVGANVECRPEVLCQFGIMGSAYMKGFCGKPDPRVGLLNVGTEDTKGGTLQKEAFALLKEAPINFIGNVEARDVPAGICDVLVNDGFSGNIVLKLTEGVALVFMGNLKDILMRSLPSKLAAMMLKPGLRAFKHKLDYTEYGGAPLMGISKPVIKAHGSSNANAFKNAVRQAKAFAESGAIAEIAAIAGKKREENQQ